MEKRYEILEYLPPYEGRYISFSYGIDPVNGQHFPIKFLKQDGTSWYANFQRAQRNMPDISRKEGIFELKSSKRLLVFASGNCYLVDPDIDRYVCLIGGGYSDILVPDLGFYVLVGMTSLTIVDPDGDSWSTRAFSYDGLKDVKVNGTMVTGFWWGLEDWYVFSYDINTNTLTGGKD